MSAAQYAAAAGVTRSTISHVLYGKDQKTVRAGTAEQLLRITAATAPPPHVGWVGPTGACRRLQALTVTGWSPRLLAARTGLAETAVRRIRDGCREQIHARSDQQITAVFDALWDKQPPQATRADRISVAKSRAYAARRRWAPAAAWDDHTIGDLAAKPEGLGRGRVSRYSFDLAQLAGWYDSGLSVRDIGALLEVSSRTAYRHLVKAGVDFRPAAGPPQAGAGRNA